MDHATVDTVGNEAASTPAMVNLRRHNCLERHLGIAYPTTFQDL
jgi:nitrate/TMAO reductase-like tetraheme cytochrome c subunit